MRRVAPLVPALIALVTLAVPVPAAAQAPATAQDSAGIRKASLDYIEGWYTADADRMTAALHPELVKRIMTVDNAGRAWISQMGATQLIRGVASGGGKSAPAAEKRSDVKILDVFGNAAFKADNPAFVGHHKLARGLGSRAERYLAINKQMLGEEAFEGIEIILPTVGVDKA